MNFYSHFIGDYARDTAHLTLAEHGAYRVLMDSYYATERPLPADLPMLYRICKAFSAAEKRAVEMVAKHFFQVGKDGLRHNPRADLELAKAHAYADAQSMRAHKRWHKSGNATAMPDDMQRQCRNDATHTHKEKPTTAAEAAFAEIWPLYPRRDGDNPKRRAWKAFRARLAEGHSAEEIRSGVERYAAWVRARGKEGTESVKQAATFFGPDKPFLAPWDAEPQPANVAPLYRREGVM